MRQESTYDSIIIGAGLSGLALAIRLKNRGERVLVVERQGKVGGKLDQFEWNNFRWDKGPSVFTQPEQVEALFKLSGKKTEDFFTYKKLEESCRYFFNGERIIFHHDKQKREHELKNHFSTEEIEAVNDYLNDAKRSHMTVGDFFISNPKPRLRDFWKPSLLRRYMQFLKPSIRKTLNAYNEKKLNNPKLVKIFNRYGTYNGSNPYRMSALFSIISHLENNEGVYFPNDGIRSIAESTYSLAKEIGVDFRFNEDVVASKSNNEFIVEGKETFKSKKLVSAIDQQIFYKDVWKDQVSFKRYDKYKRSSSAIIFYWAIDDVLEDLGVHNIFFSEDYKQEFNQLFDKCTIPVDPTIYVHITSVVNSDDAPKGKQNWFVMVHSPPGIYPSEEQLKSVRDTILSHLEKDLGRPIRDKILHEDYWTAREIEDITGGYKGSLYGPASNELLSSMKRHDNRSKVDGLYFCGGTVHPGGGMPLVLRSAKIVDNLCYGK